MNDRFLSMLGIARRAGKTEFGYDKALSAVHSRKAKAVFCAADLSPKTKRGLDLAADGTSIKIISTDRSMFDISNAVGSKTGVVAVTDLGIAKKLVSLYTESGE